MNAYNLNRRTPNEIDLLIAGRLRDIRRRRRISQARLAEKSGVSLGSIKRFEQTGEISLHSLTKLSLALEVDRELEGLFAEAPYLSIDEVIYESNETNHKS